MTEKTPILRQLHRTAQGLTQILREIIGSGDEESFRSQPVLPMRPGQSERRSHDYTRHGTTSLFAVLEIKSG